MVRMEMCHDYLRDVFIQIQTDLSGAGLADLSRWWIVEAAIDNCPSVSARKEVRSNEFQGKRHRQLELVHVFYGA